MKLELNEKTLNTYIYAAINEELEERFLGIPGRNDLNNKWGYEWDDSLSNSQNRKNRRVNRAQIKAKGYRNYDEYQAGEGEEQQLGTETQQQAQGYPQEYPYKSDKQKTGQFQTWFNQEMGGKLVVDGIWGPKTEAAYQQWLSQQN